MLAEAGLVDLCQPHLADRGAGLQLMDAGGPALETEALHAFGDRAGTDQHHLLAECAQMGDLHGPFGDRGMVEAFAIVGHQR